MTDWTPAIVQSLYIFLVAFAIVTDVSSLRVPNWIPLSLCGLFLVYVAMTGSLDQLAMALLVGAGVLAAGFALFSLSVFGGGDAKLLSALALWMGPGHIGAFVILTALLGGVMAAGLIGLKRLLILNPALERHAALARPAAWARADRIPYALPLGLAALILGPRLF